MICEEMGTESARASLGTECNNLMLIVYRMELSVGAKIVIRKLDTDDDHILAEHTSVPTVRLLKKCPNIPSTVLLLCHTRTGISDGRWS